MEPTEALDQTEKAIEGLFIAVDAVIKDSDSLREAVVVLLKEALMRCEGDLGSTVMHNPERTVWLREQRTELRALLTKLDRPVGFSA